MRGKPPSHQIPVHMVDLSTGDPSVWCSSAHSSGSSAVRLATGHLRCKAKHCRRRPLTVRMSPQGGEDSPRGARCYGRSRHSAAHVGLARTTSPALASSFHSLAEASAGIDGGGSSRGLLLQLTGHADAAQCRAVLAVVVAAGAQHRAVRSAVEELV